MIEHMGSLDGARVKETRRIKAQKIGSVFVMKHPDAMHQKAAP